MSEIEKDADAVAFLKERAPYLKGTAIPRQRILDRAELLIAFIQAYDAYQAWERK